MPVEQLTTRENRYKVEVCFPLGIPSPLIIPQRRRCLSVRTLLYHQAQKQGWGSPPFDVFVVSPPRKTDRGDGHFLIGFENNAWRR